MFRLISMLVYGCFYKQQVNLMLLVLLLLQIEKNGKLYSLCHVNSFTLHHLSSLMIEVS